MWIAVFFGTLAAIIVDVTFDYLLKAIFIDKLLAGYVFKIIRVIVAVIVFFTIINLYTTYVKDFN
jgi:Na+/H+-dicarboxylate symporter